MTILSIIPVAGSGLVWGPAGIIRILGGHVFSGVAILVIGVAIISTIDNVLRPRLVGQDTTMHPLFIFLGTLGGISLFGIVGFLVGPVVAALFVTIWDIYAIEFKEHLGGTPQGVQPATATQERLGVPAGEEASVPDEGDDSRENPVRS
jgi:predicted PurR-regulated permease PerM